MILKVMVEQEIQIEDDFLKEVAEEGELDSLSDKTIEDWIYDSYGESSYEGLSFDLTNVPELVRQIREAINNQI